MFEGDDRFRAVGRESLVSLFQRPVRDGTSRSSEPVNGALGARIA
jgi:hypothetical protein